MSSILKKYHDKGIGKSDFSNLFGVLGPVGGIIFDSLDTDRKGSLDTSKVILYMAVLMKGSVQERFSAGFNLFDIERTGELTSKHFSRVLNGLFLGLDHMNVLVQSIVKKWEKEMWSLMDPKNNGFITLAEYESFVTSHYGYFVGMGSHASEEYPFVRSKPPGENLFFGAKEWTLGLEMMMGIRNTVGMTAKTTRTLKREDFLAEMRFYLPTTRDDHLEFISYAPQAFEQLRAMFNITDEDYLLGLGPEQILGNFLVGRLSSFSEKVSDGKSGSFFFFSHDNRFMAKTISKTEARSFVKILPKYHQYMKENPNSTLVRIFGWHELQDQPFIVMGSVFPTAVKLHECFDLKGSTVGRSNPNGFVKKDNDIKKGHFRFPIEDKLRLRAQMKKDTEFLKSLNIIDYSFLCGVHNTTKGDITPAISMISRCETIKSTSVVFGDDAVYFVGIIDIFTVYDLKKLTEHNMKSIVYSSKEISSVPAPQYQERFMKFIENCLQ